MQSIPKQIKRLEDIIDKLHNRSDSTLGTSDQITQQALKALIFLQGLKYDMESQAKIQEIKETQNSEAELKKE